MINMQRAPSAPLGTNEVHVWGASLDDHAPEAATLEATLSHDELARARRFRFARDRARYVVGRGLLRRVLGGYLDANPAELQFAYGPYGKPALAHWRDLQFNVSHSESRFLVALTGAAILGVDLERRRPEFARENIAERFFSPYEVRELRSLPEDAQPDGFLACWTRKEALVKAVGDGLSIPLHDFDVSLAPGVRPALLRTAWSSTEPRRWRLYDLSGLHPGYVAALAVRWRGGSIESREWTPNEDVQIHAIERSYT